MVFRRKRRPTAIFAANDDMAAGVMRVADRLGIKVPGQLSVAGCDDIALAQQIYPALTTINQPLAQMAEAAVLMLTRMGEKEYGDRIRVVGDMKYDKLGEPLGEPAGDFGFFFFVLGDVDRKSVV